MKRIAVFALLMLAAFFTPVKPVDLKHLAKDSIKVSIRGQVERPGTYTLQRYATIEEAIQEAGLKDSADLSSLNPMAILADKDVLDIPSSTTPSGLPRISINTATSNELETLPGIGPAMAERIIAYRNEHGLFQNVEDLMQVKGIGNASFEKLKDRIRL